MILGIIILTASVLGLGYAMYNSNKDTAQELQDDWYVAEQQPSYPPQVDEVEVAGMLKQLIEHTHTYAQYYEQKEWERHNCIELGHQCMALPQNSEERLALYEVYKRDVTEHNSYIRAMESYSQHELDQGWHIALELKNMQLHNPEQAALLAEYWEKLVPYVLSENYNHISLQIYAEDKTFIIQQSRMDIVRDKQMYERAHKEEFIWEQKYNHLKGEKTMSDAELATARLDMEAADHALARMLAENLPEQTLANAYAQAEEKALVLKEAQVKAAKVDKAKLELETARMDKQGDKLEQILMQHNQPGEELHPNLPQGARIVPGNDSQPPPTGGGWWHDIVEWIWSWIM